MVDNRKKQMWFVSFSLGRMDIINWRGAVAFASLMLVLMTGTVVESALKPEHPVVALLVMIPLALVALGLAVVIVMRTK